MAEPVRARRLSEDEGRRLQQIVRRGKHGSVRVRRALIIMASASGTPVPAIARLVAADEDERGLAALDPQWAGGRPRLISDEDIAFIVVTATTRPKTLGMPVPSRPSSGPCARSRWRTRTTPTTPCWPGTCRPTCAGATPTPATPTSWPPSAANAPASAARRATAGDDPRSRWQPADPANLLGQRTSQSGPTLTRSRSPSRPFSRCATPLAGRPVPPRQHPRHVRVHPRGVARLGERGGDVMEQPGRVEQEVLLLDAQGEAHAGGSTPARLGPIAGPGA